ncbi:MFS transporter [Virgibacillus halophilus]|uniref:MFS transporter n=1 Tax=Tigheibacillus halophilus TaxID=361280 RepID=A0ABU5C2N9_9BACI|nr:MFS transporter [Virgibacillus halophilus]
MKKSRVLLASLSGSVIEWYDFYLYGTATGLVFSTLFFPSHDPSIGILLSFATFGVGYAARPIGSIIFGHFGDKIGRKTALMLTLIGMGGSSFFIGLLPTYESIGLAAPLILVVLRLVQGIALGGEWGGAVLLATEYAPKGLRGLYGSIPQMGVPFGLVLGSLSLTFISYFTTDAQFLAWGWRIPFLFSVVLIVLALWIRGGIEETPEFKEQKESGQLAEFPIVDTLKKSLEERGPCNWSKTRGWLFQCVHHVLHIDFCHSIFRLLKRNCIDCTYSRLCHHDHYHSNSWLSI